MLHKIRQFLQIESASGIILMSVSMIALIFANSNLHTFYYTLIHQPFGLNFSVFEFKKPLTFWINDGLMVLFFFIIGLEVKRELLEGRLAKPSQRILPALATLGGIVFPALIYIFINWNEPQHLRGWAIPTATDIAFALGVLMLLGKRIPQTLRIFLLTVAVLDDLSAVLIIALFYTSTLSSLYLLLALVVYLAMLHLNRRDHQTLKPYIFMSIFLWIFTLLSGVHPTIAGVLAAFTIPLGNQNTQLKQVNRRKLRPLERLEQALHPYVAYLILPLFAFANAGVSFSGLKITEMLNPLPLGIILGLFLGKQLGIFVCTWLPIHLSWAKLPQEVSWLQLYGVSILCGIGFTMSLFIGALAFSTEFLSLNQALEFERYVKIGVLIASLLSSIYGYCMLCYARASRP